MKVVYIECNEDELRANRGIMDAVVDMMSGVLSSVYGTCNPVCDESDESEVSEDDSKSIYKTN